MSRTNKTRRRGSHTYVCSGATTWAQRTGNKVDRVWMHQNIRVLNMSVFEQLLEDIAADRLEEAGALEQAMKLRNRNEPALPVRRNERWRGWWL